MDKPKDFPAFPVSEQGFTGVNGMSFRRWAVVQLLTGFYANPNSRISDIDRALTIEFILKCVDEIIRQTQEKQ